MEWPLQDAKNRLSKVVQDARAVGPQTITVRGKRAAVILSIDDYERLLPKEADLGRLSSVGTRVGRRILRDGQLERRDARA